ncbi:MAG: NUDIX domain-containing protein [Candidatus Taylorbacteria bacterium]|nr:NUDIX domain-containing protein [Candidatus Taylorbacteria bacterium]
MSGKAFVLKAMCLFVHDGKVLLQAPQTLKPNKAGINFYRPVGGHIEYLETSEQCIKREIQEELCTQVLNLTFLEAIENIFEYNDRKVHEIVFLYKGDLENKDLYKKEKIHIVEKDYEFDAVWIEIEKILNGEIILVPKTDYQKFLS